MIDSTEYFAVAMLSAYFMFLFGMIYMSWNVERVAQNPALEALVDKVRYNLRDLPRVDYREFTNETDSQEEEEEEAASEASEEESDEPSVRKRRDRNPIANLLDHIN
jgi:hypothetical protein